MVDDDGWFRQQPERVRNTLVAGLIQNFEFVFELSVKMIVRRLGMSFVSRDEVAGYSYRDLMRTAG